MRTSITVKFFFIILAVILSLYLLYPTYQLSMMSKEKIAALEVQDKKGLIKLKAKTINLGLDLQGGMHVVMEVDIKELMNQLAKNKNEIFTSALDKSAAETEASDEDFISVLNENLQAAGSNLMRYYGSRELNNEEKIIDYLRIQSSETVTRALEILTNRVDEFGVAEPIIQRQGDSRIIIELAGITDPARVRQLIGKTAKLEFRLLRDPEICLNIADKINKFIQSKVAPLDSSMIEPEEKEVTPSDSAVSLDKLFGESRRDTVSAGIDSTQESIFEQNLFFQDPNNRQTLLVPVEKEEKFRQVLALPKVQKIVSDEAGDAEFLWGSEPRYERFYEVYLVFRQPELTGETITEADPMAGSQMDPNAIGKFEVSLTLNDEGARIFSRVTGANIKKRLAIVLDRKVYLAPEIQVKIRDGRSRITGLNTMEEAKDLAIVLKAGALPAPVRIIEERTVGPSLGRDSVNQGSYSAILGFITVAIFMLIYYRLSGSIADIALFANVLFILAVMAYFNATLTLPGIAGIILTMGMAVDANVLINERIREELRHGKTIKAAVDQGYSNAFRAILDSNVTTFIAGVVLYTFGTGAIRGFALTLMIGIISSMFTAIVITRLIYDYLISKWNIQRLSI
jgi:preprotein translocase subunit SecD